MWPFLGRQPIRAMRQAKRDGSRRKSFGMKLQYLDVLDSNDIAIAFREASKAHADAVLVLASPVFTFSAKTDYRPRGEESCSRRFIRMANMWRPAGL